MTVRDPSGGRPVDEGAYRRFRDAMAVDLLIGRVPPGRDGMLGHALANAGLGATQTRAFVYRLLVDLRRGVDRHRRGA